MSNLKWEQIENESSANTSTNTFRLSVFGGWIVKSRSKNPAPTGNGPQIATILNESTCFVPDPEHRWNLNNESNG